MKFDILLISGSILLFFACCSQSEKLDDKPINQYQVIGSHNSYKEAIDPALLDSLKNMGLNMDGLEYAHIPLSEQLDMGLRNLEIDVYADSRGGRYAHPKGLDLAPGQSPYNTDGIMNKPGFKVFHVTDIDFRSSCPTLEICLQQIKNWSDANPGHFPVFITLEVKGNIEGTAPQDERLTPSEKITAALFDKLDSAITAGLGEEKLITPDFVRGEYETLNEAITTGDWPTLKEAKGRFLFILDDKGAKRELYLSGHPSLKGRVMFVNTEAGKPESAAMIRNNPEDTLIPELVKQGYIIRTRADANTVEARNNDYSRFEASCRSGAQIITTDYYKPGTFFDSSYHIAFKDSTYTRKNLLFTEN
ncbi:MAG: phosphatidylinositol-specific phospholipase C1-like protein [Mangrovibacterium sp.]